MTQPKRSRRSSQRSPLVRGRPLRTFAVSPVKGRRGCGPRAIVRGVRHIALVSLLLTACQASHGDSLGPDEFRARFAASWCERALRCGAAGLRWERWCEPSAGDLLGAAAFMVYDEELARRCLEGIEEDASCAPDGPEACARAFHGAVPEGSPCTFDRECAWGTYCNDGIVPIVFSSLDATCTGVCEPWRGVGEECGDEAALGCGWYLRCGTTPGDPVRRCHEPAAEGEPCGAGCGPNLTCDQQRDVCYPILEATGRPCDPEGIPAVCPGQTHSCSTEGVCQPRPSPTAGPGEACAPGQCPSSFACVDGVCLALPRLGDACDEARVCTSGQCVDGRCWAPGPGEPCVDGWCRGWCDEAGLCRAPLAEGEASEGHWQCAWPTLGGGCVAGRCIPEIGRCE